MFQIILSKNAAKEFGHLSKKDQKKIYKKLQLLREEPLAGKKLTGKLKGLSSIKAWPFRIVYEIARFKRVVIHHIAHRKSVYRK